MIFSFYIYSQYLVMIIIPYISTVLSTLRQAAHTPTPTKKKRKKNNGSPLDTLPSLLISCVHLCAISYWQPCVNLECTSAQMLQEQITWSKIPTSESNRYIFYKILIVDCTVPRCFQMSPSFWRVGAPGPQNWNSWLEHCISNIKPISTISMHIPSLVKIHWCLLNLSSGNEIWMDGRTTDWQTDKLTSSMKPKYPATIMWQGIIRNTKTNDCFLLLYCH